MIYKTSKLILAIISTLTLYSCGTHELRPVEYIEVGRGEKALLITDNSGTFNIIDLFFDSISGSSEHADINTVDGKKARKKILKDNHHVLVEPGIRKIGLSCQINFKSKSKKTIYGRNTIEVDFKGGYTYKISVSEKHEKSVRYNSETSLYETTYRTCKANIALEKNLYNKSLKSDAAQKTSNAP